MGPSLPRMDSSTPGPSIKIDIDRKVNFYDYFKDELKSILLKKLVIALPKLSLVIASNAIFIGEIMPLSNKL